MKGVDESKFSDEVKRLGEIFGKKSGEILERINDNLEEYLDNNTESDAVKNVSIEEEVEETD